MSDVKTQIEGILNQNKVVLFMKGSPQFPMCGFSASATQMLKACGVDQPFTVDGSQAEPAASGPISRT